MNHQTPLLRHHSRPQEVIAPSSNVGKMWARSRVIHQRRRGLRRGVPVALDVESPVVAVGFQPSTTIEKTPDNTGISGKIGGLVTRWRWDLNASWATSDLHGCPDSARTRGDSIVSGSRRIKEKCGQNVGTDKGASFSSPNAVISSGTEPRATHRLSPRRYRRKANFTTSTPQAAVERRRAPVPFRRTESAGVARRWSLGRHRAVREVEGSRSSGYFGRRRISNVDRLIE